MDKFRDPIHGFIEVSAEELTIINTQEFQRLRRIKQLATTYLVYHGAEHTRFGHSLGVMELVTRAFNSALKNYEQDNPHRRLFNDDTQKVYTQILRLIALLHDIGHAPFSHACEEAFEDGLTHEDFTKQIILRSPIKDVINKIGEDFKNKYKKCNTIISAELIWLIYGEEDDVLKNKDYIITDFKFLKSFMNSDIDCDKMDYLLRDSYYCGVNYGTYDLNRLIKCLTVYEKDGTKQLAFMKSGLQALEEFVLARYFMFIQVYFHRTRRFLDKQFSECIKEAFKDSPLTTRDIDKFIQEDDITVWERIKRLQKKGFVPAKNLFNRIIYTCVYESDTVSKTSDGNRLFKIIKDEIIKQRLDENDYVIDQASKMPHQFPAFSPFDDDSGKGIPVLNKNKPQSIAGLSVILKSLNEFIWIQRIYLNEKHDALIKRLQKKYNK